MGLQVHFQVGTITPAPVFVCTFQCLQRHFSGWYSAVLDQRICMGKVMALCDWKRKLRAWRGWRAAVWAGQKQQEVARTEEELRAENRQGSKQINLFKMSLLKLYVSSQTA